MPVVWNSTTDFWGPTSTSTGNFYIGPWTTGSLATVTFNVTNSYPPGILDDLWYRPVRAYGPVEPGRIAPPDPRPLPRAATTRARELLTGFLNDLQKAQYEETGKFDIVGSDGTLYRIGPGTNGNVEWIDPATGRVQGRLCAHPRTYDHESRRIPDPDLHLGQLLALTTDERAWLEVANLHRGEWPPTHRARRIEVHAAA